MAQEWTDGRLDDLCARVDRGFAEVDRRFDQADQRFGRIEGEITELRGEVKAGFARMDERLDSLSRAMIFALIAITGGILTGFSAILVLIATQI
jgi:hypothetical protein